MPYRPFTKRGYDLFSVASALQKSIRRGDARTAGYFALELYASGYANYVWKRLLVISAEDVAGAITKEINALHDAFLKVNKGRKKLDKPEGRLFIAKAVLLLAQAWKCRDADHLIIFVYDQENVKPAEAKAFLEQITAADRMEIPEYAYDCHTAQGKAAGKTKDDFLKAEFAALNPKHRGLFDELV